MRRPSSKQRPSRALLALVAGLPIAAAATAQADPRPRGAPPAPAPAAAEPQAATTYVIDMLSTGPLSPDLQQRMKPLNTLQAIEDLLKANSIAFSWRRFEASTATLNPAFAQQLAALPPKEVFVAPQGSGWSIGVIVGSR